jgi:hypothetical protein
MLAKIEYREQTTVFTEKENDDLMKPFGKMFKNKLSFTISAPNSIVENSLIYKILSFNVNRKLQTF